MPDITKEAAKTLAERLNSLMAKVRAKATPSVTDDEGNIVAHTTSLTVEEIESEVELIHMIVDGMAKTDEERDDDAVLNEQESVYFRGLGV